MTCKTVKKRLTRKIHGKPHKVTVKRRKCTGRLVSGKVKFTIGSRASSATLSRKSTVYATGVSVPGPHGKSHLVLTDRRPVKGGRYTLTLRIHHQGRWVVRRSQITIK